MVIEDHVLLAAMKLSHGENLITTITGLHKGIKALEDALTRNLEAFNWFNLSIPTDLAICQPLQSLLAAEINYSSLLLNQFKTPVGLENAAGSTILQSPSISPQLLEFGQLRLNEDVPMVEDNCVQTETQMQTEQDEEPKKHEEQRMQLDNLDAGNKDSGRHVCKENSDGRNGESRGEKGEDKHAIGVKEAQKNKMEEDHEEKGQEKQERQQEKQEDEDQETKVDQRSFDFDSHLSSEEEEEEEEDLQEQEQDKKEKDAAELDPKKSDPEEEQGEQLDAVEKDAEESDVVEEDSAEEDREEENKEQEENEEDKEQVKLLPECNLHRSTHLQMQTANPPSSYEPPARTQKQPGGNASESEPLRTRANMLEVVSVLN
jgi:hypothetical protein